MTDTPQPGAAATAPGGVVVARPRPVRAAHLAPVGSLALGAWMPAPDACLVLGDDTTGLAAVGGSHHIDHSTGLPPRAAPV